MGEIPERSVKGDENLAELDRKASIFYGMASIFYQIKLGDYGGGFQVFISSGFQDIKYFFLVFFFME